MVVPVQLNCAHRMAVSACAAPSAVRKFHSAWDQISPSSWTSPSRSAGYILAVSRRRMQCSGPARVRGRIPVHQAGRICLARSAGLCQSPLADVACPVVAKALADRASLVAREERGRLAEVDLVAQLVEDDLGVLGVIDAALAEAHLVLGMVGRERVVDSPLVDAHALLVGIDRRPVGSYAEAERTQVELRLR